MSEIFFQSEVKLWSESQFDSTEVVDVGEVVDAIEVEVVVEVVEVVEVDVVEPRPCPFFSRISGARYFGVPRTVVAAGAIDLAANATKGLVEGVVRTVTDNEEYQFGKPRHRRHDSQVPLAQAI